MKKRSISFLLSLSLVFSTFTPTLLAQEVSQEEKTRTTYNQQNVQVDGVNTTIKLSDTVIGKVSEKEIKTIIRQARSTGSGDVTIHNVVPASPNRVKRAWYDTHIDWSTVRSNISHDNPGQAQLIISVARGTSKKLSSSVTKRVVRSINLGAGLPSSARAHLEAGITHEISKTYTTEHTWNGPLESSSYISRSYYFTPFYDYGDYKVTGTGNFSGDSYGPYTGTYKRPTHYTEWSRDIR